MKGVVHAKLFGETGHARTYYRIRADEIKVALDEFVRDAGDSPDEVAGEAIKQYLFERRFRSLRRAHDGRRPEPRHSH